MSALDVAIARTIQVGYAAVSVLTGDPMPMGLMNTYLASERIAYDGVFALSESQVERIIARNPEVSAELSTQLLLLQRAFVSLLKGTLKPGAGGALIDWASNVIGRLRADWRKTGAPSHEDVTTADFAVVVKGVRTRGKEVQVGPENFSTYISFGVVRLHLEGRLSIEPPSQGDPELVRASLKPWITDVFDFHSTDEDIGTGWMDHALSRLQRSHYTKPFRIEGCGKPRDFVVGESA